MEIHEADLIGLTKTVWSSFVGLEIDELEAPPPCTDGEPAICARVEISGAWQGAVAVTCSETLAQRIAAAMFEMQPNSVRSADVGDCLGELANVLAGNVKAASCMPCDVSLPLLEFGTRAASAVAAATTQVSFSCAGQLISVSIAKPSDADIAQVPCADADPTVRPGL